MILRRVIWPEPDSDDEAPLNLEQSCDVTAFLREYIQTGENLLLQVFYFKNKGLMYFWCLVADVLRCNEKYCFTQTDAGPPAELRELLKFWTGWAVLPQHLYVEVSPDLSLPVASTCLTTLKLPLRCRTFLAFTQAMRAAVSSTRFGFGLVWVATFKGVHVHNCMFRKKLKWHVYFQFLLLWQCMFLTGSFPNLLELLETLMS